MLVIKLLTVVTDVHLGKKHNNMEVNDYCQLFSYKCSRQQSIWE